MKLKVLAIDDEKAILSMLQAALEDEGFDLSTAESVQQFREADASGDFDLYLVDVTLRDGNGLTIVRELRQKSDRGIIVLSGRTSETDRVLGLELGADDYVTKPFRVRELAARMNALYRRTGPRSPASASLTEAAGDEQVRDVEYEFDGYRLRLSARTLRGPDDQEIVLTTSEFNLLAALLTRRGRVLDRDQLMNAIKGRDWEAYDRAVDGLVSRLRRKIPPLAQQAPYIRTVHGIGYMFSG